MNLRKKKLSVLMTEVFRIVFGQIIFFNFHIKISVMKELLYIIPSPSFPEYCFLLCHSYITRRY